MSALLQLHIISPLVIVSYFYKPKLGLSLNIMAIIIGLYSSIAPKHLYAIETYFEMRQSENFESIMNSYKYFHISTNQYLTNFFCGTLFGYLLYAKPNLNFGGKSVERFLWVMLVAIIALTVSWNNSMFTISEMGSSQWSIYLYFSVGKLIWGLACGWGFYASCTDRSGKTKFFIK